MQEKPDSATFGVGVQELQMGLLGSQDDSCEVVSLVTIVDLGGPPTQ